MKSIKLILRGSMHGAWALLAVGPLAASPLVLAQPAKSNMPADTADGKDTTSDTAAAGSMQKQPVTPANFVSMASQDGMAEVEMAKLALRKAKATQVRDFAQQMVRDHERANTELKTIAATKHLKVADSLDTDHQQMLDDLASKSGSEFDAAYVQHMNAAHAKAVALFQQGAVSSDADIAMFASKTLPTLRNHQQMAMQLKQASTAPPVGKSAGN